MKKKNRIFGKVLMVLMIAFFYVPILYMIVFSFNDGKSLTSFSGFSLRWYRHMLESQDMMTAFCTKNKILFFFDHVSHVVIRAISSVPDKNINQVSGNRTGKRYSRSCNLRIRG